MKNFGLIKNSFNTILSESIGGKDLSSKSLFKNYLKQIKESEILKTQFLIYKNIEDTVELNETNAIEFVKENIALMQKFTKEEILDANKNLASEIPSSLALDNIYENSKIKNLHENISKLILIKKSPNTVGEIVESTIKVATYINNNKTKIVNEDLGIPNSLIANIAVDKFNEKYESLNESDKTVVKLVIESDANSRCDFFNESVKSCLSLINNRLKDSDVSVKESLLAAKENLLNREFNDTTFVKDIAKILELSKDLE